MTAAPTSPARAAPDPAAALRVAVAARYPELCRGAAALVLKALGPLRPHEVQERVEEVLAEAVRRGLARAGQYDPARSPVAWLLGIVARILHEQRRSIARDRRQVAGTDLGDAAWRALLDGQGIDPADDARIDVRQALAGLPEEARRAVELRYFEGLDGEELARRLGAPSAGAARVRVFRALQLLRARLGQSEVRP